MKLIALLATLFAMTVLPIHAESIYDIKLKDIDGKDTTLAAYKGKVVLIVNVASKCGYTPQYQGLEATYEKYKGQGFVVLGFPCNQFGSQSRARTRRSSSSAPANTTSPSRCSTRLM